MNACQPRDFGAESVRNAALFPLEEALGRKGELAAENLFEVRDQRAMVVPGFGHAPTYQRSVYNASPQSLMAAYQRLLHNARMSLGQRITDAYAAMGLSQAEAARRCGWSAQRFGNYVGNKRMPDLNSLMKMADAFGVTPDHLLGINEQSAGELTYILGKLLELEGLDPESARTIAEAASATQQVLKSLPEVEGDPDRARLVAQAVWSARRLPQPGTPLDR